MANHDKHSTLLPPAAGVFNLLLLLLLLDAAASIPLAAASRPLAKDEDICVYTIYVRTGSIWKGGTDSVISLAIADASGSAVNITNLEEFGLMGPGHDYFERGALDIFSGRGPCLKSGPCLIQLSSDGSGPGHGWYCNYVEVTTTGLHQPCAQQQFTVEQWLARDAPPYELTATRDNCPRAAAEKAGAPVDGGDREEAAVEGQSKLA